MADDTVCQNPEDLTRRRTLHLGTGKGRRPSGPFASCAVAIRAVQLKELQACDGRVRIVHHRIALRAVFGWNLGK